MSADPTIGDDPLLTVRDVCDRHPGCRGGKQLAASTVSRWICSGCPGRSGERVKLAAMRCGSRWLIRESALAEFFRRLAGEQPPQAASPAPAVVSRAAQRAAAALEAAGA